MTVLATLGIAVIAALGTGAQAQASMPAEGLCSLPASAIPAPPQVVLRFAPPTPSDQDWCTERDGVTDPRCDAGDTGSPAGAPSTASPLSPPDLFASEDTACVHPDLADPPAHGPGSGPGRRLLNPIERPPRA